MSIQKRTSLRLVIVGGITTALLLGCEGGRRGEPFAEEATMAATAGQVPGKVPPIPPAGPLAEPRSLQQVGVPAELTRTMTPPDNPQTPEKIGLGQKLFFDGRQDVDWAGFAREVSESAGL